MFRACVIFIAILRSPEHIFLRLIDTDIKIPEYASRVDKTFETSLERF